MQSLSKSQWLHHNHITRTCHFSRLLVATAMVKTHPLRPGPSLQDPLSSSPDYPPHTQVTQSNTPNTHCLAQNTPLVSHRTEKVSLAGNGGLSNSDLGPPAPLLCASHSDLAAVPGTHGGSCAFNSFRSLCKCPLSHQRVQSGSACQSPCPASFFL